MQKYECIKEKIGEQWKKLGEMGESIVWVYKTIYKNQLELRCGQTAAEHNNDLKKTIN